MTRREAMESLEELRNVIDKLTVQDIDDPEAILTDLAINSERFSAALGVAIGNLEPKDD